MRQRQQTESLPGQLEFLDWVRRKWYRNLIAGAGIVYSAVSLYLTVYGRIGTGNSAGGLLQPQSIPSFLELAALLPLLVASFIVKPMSLFEKPPGWDRSTENEMAVRSCKQFKWALVCLTGMWAAFYLLMFVYRSMADSPLRENLKPWIDLFNNLQGLFLFASYWILTNKTISPEGENGSRKRDRKLPLWGLYLLLLWAVLLFHLADVQLSPFINRQVLQLFSGLWVGACLALLIGCLEGQYLGQPRWIEFFLYFYAALQVAYVGFLPKTSGSDILESVAIITSLPLKLLLVGFWTWTLEIGLLAFHMQKTRRNIDEVDGQWKQFCGFGGTHGERTRPSIARRFRPAGIRRGQVVFGWMLASQNRPQRGETAD